MWWSLSVVLIMAENLFYFVHKRNFLKNKNQKQDNIRCKDELRLINHSQLPRRQPTKIKILKFKLPAKSHKGIDKLETGASRLHLPSLDAFRVAFYPDPLVMPGRLTWESSNYIRLKLAGNCCNFLIFFGHRNGLGLRLVCFVCRFAVVPISVDRFSFFSFWGL